MKQYEKARTRRETLRAIRAGVIQKPDACEECGNTGYLQAHHSDYADHLTVVFLCQPCHAREHTRLNHVRWLGADVVDRIRAIRGAS